MNTSEQIGEIAAALAKAQGEFPKIGKNKHASVKGTSKASGKEYSIGYNYADIADVISAVAPVLSANGIAYIQATKITEFGMMIETRLIHSSGQWMASDYPVSSVNGDHQKMGGALTYARRYALSSLVGVAAEEDLDGEGAEEVPPHRPAQLAPANRKDRFIAAVKDTFPGAQVVRDEIPFGDPEEPNPAAYVSGMKTAIEEWTGTSDALKMFWHSEAKQRAFNRVVEGTPEYKELYDALVARGTQIAGRGRAA